MSESNRWVVIKDKTQDHWLEVRDPEGWWSAYVKWDGCIGFTRYHNNSMDSIPSDKPWNDFQDNIHICDLDELIKRLQDLKEEAIKHFGQDWS